MLIVLFLVTVLNCSGKGGSFGLFKSSVNGNGRYGRSPLPCATLSAHCPCGLDGRTTVIQVKQCPFSTDWDTLCAPCVPHDELCKRLANCSRCSDTNPAAICAECPPTRYGMNCQHELECALPELSMYTKSRPIITEASRRKRRRRSGKEPKQTYKLEFSCPDDMMLKGPRVIKCKRNGEWNRLPPRCVFPLECPSQVPPIDGARVTEQTRLHVRFACDTGHVNVTNVTEARMQCENGAWVSINDDGLLQCKPLTECDGYKYYNGAHLTQDTADKATYYHGEHVHYECAPGYSPSYPQHLEFKLTCDRGAWIGNEPHCAIYGCPKFGVAEGKVTYSPAPADDTQYVDLHTVSHVHCEEDRKLVPLKPAGDLTCTESGRWQPEIPRCERVCGSPLKCPVPKITNAIPDTEKPSILPGQIVRFRCAEGSYRNLSTPFTERFCLINGTLTGSNIQCTELVTCNITKLHIRANLKFCRGSLCQRGQRQDVQYEMPEELVFWRTVLVFTGCEPPELYDLVQGPSTEIMCRAQDTFSGYPPYCKPKCGIRYAHVTGRVLGGTKTHVSDWPWQAGVLHVRGASVHFLCGAVLIAEEWALTAAHCLYTNNKNSTRNTRVELDVLSFSELNVIFGVDANPERAEKKFRHSVQYASVHPKYRDGEYDNDIALLKLTRPITLSKMVGMACLSCDNSTLATGHVGVVTGWGQDLNELRSVQLTVTNVDDCKEHFRNQGYSDVTVTDNMFCTASNTSTDDASSGDSGGPFLIQGEDKGYVLEGIVSWGEEHNSADFADAGPTPSRRENRSGVNAKNTRLSSSPGEEKAVDHDMTGHCRGGLCNTSQYRCRGQVCYGGYTRVAMYVKWIEEVTSQTLCGN